MMKSDTADRLSKLIPLLGSNQPGEVTNAASAICRTLAANDMDLHDLVKRITGGSSSGPTFADKQREAARKRSEADAARQARVRRQERPERICEEYGSDYRRSYPRTWKVIVDDLLKLNRTIPRRYGGKSLMDHQIKILKRVSDHSKLTNAEASAIERMIELMDIARETRDAETYRKSA